MSNSHPSLLLKLLLPAVLLLGGCDGPAEPTGIPEDVLQNNIRGTAYLGQQQWADAESEFRRALDRRPQDPLLLNNTAVTLMQQGRNDEAQQLLEQALGVDPDHLQAHYNLGLIHKSRGEIEPAVAHFEAVAAQDSRDLLTQYNLGVLLARVGRGEEAEAAFRRALARNPTHVSSLYGLGIFLLQKGDRQEGQRLVELSQQIRARSGLDDAVGSQYGEQGPYALGLDYPGDSLTAPAPIAVRLSASSSTTAGYRPPVATATTHPDRQQTVLTTGEGSMLAVHGRENQAIGPLPTGDAKIVALAAGDLDNDGVVELVAAVLRSSDGRMALERATQSMDGSFGDWDQAVFAGAGNPVELDQPAAVSMVLFDRDHDSDLDAVLCWTASIELGSGCRIATNDGSGKFDVRNATEHGFDLSGMQAGGLTLSFSDIDNDRDVDLLVGETGGVHLLSNQRDGNFAEIGPRVGLQQVGDAAALVVADLDKNGRMDLLLGGAAGVRLLLNRRGEFEAPTTIGDSPLGPDGSLLVFDLDNDGFLDVARSVADAAPQIYRGLGQGRWDPLDQPFDEPPPPGTAPAAAFDSDGDGDLDLLLTSAAGTTLFINEGGNANSWIEIGSSGINDNRFGIGSKVEVLAGALRQKFEIRDTLPLHAGIGDRERVESVRHLWPGGVLQDEIDQPAGPIEVTQLDRKGTSCPLLYAWDGSAYRFVTDFLGGAAVGYRLPSGELSSPDTDEYVLIDGGLSAGADGRLRLRLNNQLEEVLWFDKAELLVVDHPAGTVVYPNERLMPGPPWPIFDLFASDDVRPIRSAVGVEDRSDQTERLAERDRRYVANFELLPFKGYAERHTLELDLGHLPASGRIVLLLDGWIDYADSSANVAARQAGATLLPPRLLVPDGRGGWREPPGRMGFPAGLPKTMSIELTPLLVRADPRIRIETSMRIYWDRARVLVGGADTPLTVRNVAAHSAELRFGGFPMASGTPPIYDPARVASHGGWKAHVGSYTAYGDVGELLYEVDDRFVTTRNGDEIELTFDAPPAAADGLQRTYLLYTDGFGKDMDPNSAASNSVGPIPFHGMPRYPYPDDTAPAAVGQPERPGRLVLPSDRGWPGAQPPILAADRQAR